MMFKQKDNAGHSMLATKLECWPRTKLTEAAGAFITINDAIMTTKQSLLSGMNEQMTHVFVGDLQYKLIWAYGNAPTKTEWDKLDDTAAISAEFRTVPMLGNYNGKSANICILALPAVTVL